MKDIYRQWGLSQDSTSEQVSAALAEKGGAEAVAISAMLANPARKAVYDKSLRCLQALGRLRSGLGIAHAHYGSVERYAAFRAEPAPGAPDWLVKLAFWALLIGGFLGWAAYDDNQRAQRREQERVTAEANRAKLQRIKVAENVAYDVAHPVLALPKTGYGEGFYRSTDNYIQVAVPAGSEHYYIKFESAKTGQQTAARFIRAGGVVQVDLPPDSYRLKYAAGREWRGEIALFGKETTYHQAGETFNLYEPGLYYELELILQRNGNLRTNAIEASSF